MDSEPNGKLAYSVEEAARVLGIGHCLCRKLIKQGKIPSIRLGERRLIVPKAALEKLLQGQAQDKSEAEKGNHKP